MEYYSEDGVPSFFTVLVYNEVVEMDDKEFRTKVIKNTALQFKIIRNKYSLSQRELAKLLQVDIREIEQVENEVDEISVSLWHLFCHTFSIDRDSIFKID